jgi:hypothetical protein
MIVDVLQWDARQRSGREPKCIAFSKNSNTSSKQVRQWNKEVYGNIFQERTLLEQKLEALQQQAIQTGYTPIQQQEEQSIRQQLEERLQQEEILWRQKSRVQWLKEGDKNTKFFHRSMIHRRFINRITKLENAHGTTLLSHQDIMKELTDYYHDLLSEPQVDRAEAIGRVTTNILTLITQEQNEALMTPISQAEVDQAIQELPAGKAPGPDGFTTDFFHACWPMLKEEVWKLVEESHSSGKVLPALNATFLTLIPKEERVTNPKNFRPIALCNVIYKIISKVIALRLKPILPFIISKEQSGYVEGRQIMDSVILVHEVIHSLKSTRTPGMLLKLDLSKSFDKLSWQYIRETLVAFGFSANWIDWIMNLITSTFFSILVNGSPSQPFSPSRGLRQGDPLSPFLFVIMAEGLGRYIKTSIGNGSLQGLPLHGLQPATSHSQFIDDTMLMSTPTVQEANKLSSILSDFSNATGTSFNLTKSQLFFFNTPQVVQQHLSQLLSILICTLPTQYLGLPLSDSAARNLSWDSLLLSISNRLSSWTFHSLNLPARITLLKSILQAIPAYLFSALAAPQSVIKKIRNLQRNFLWHGHNSDKKWALVSWDKVCKPKALGGLGLRDPGKLNNTMGAKIWWRWIKNPIEIWAQLWNYKYAPDIQHSHWIRMQDKIQGSNIWNAAWRNRPLIQEHTFWEVHNGQTARFWNDSWQQMPPLQSNENLLHYENQIPNLITAKVADMWVANPHNHSWRT